MNFNTRYEYELRSLNQCYTSISLVERAKRAHSLVMTFEIFHICVYICIIIFMYLRTSNIQCACVASSAIFENKLNGKQAQRVAGIELELAILQ